MLFGLALLIKLVPLIYLPLAALIIFLRSSSSATTFREAMIPPWGNKLVAGLGSQFRLFRGELLTQKNRIRDTVTTLINIGPSPPFKP